MSDYILGIESSCDDTSIAIVGTDYRVVAMKTVSQTSVHSLFGGIIPELAARNHIAWIFPLLRSLLDDAQMSLSDLSAIAVTTHPGLVGSLLVGVGAAKGISVATGLPLIGINHLEAHIFSAFLNRKDQADYPFLALIISGGHTSVIEVDENGVHTLGATMDDAAGEAFDKFAKMAKLGYPGGPVIDKLAQKGDASRYKMPKLLASEKYKQSYSFSFSGLKSAVQRHLQSDSIDMPGLMAAFQKSLFELVERRIVRALTQRKYKALVVVGGVSANSELRTRAQSISHRFNTPLFLPELQYCQDNGAMTAAAAIPDFEKKLFSGLDLDAKATKRETYG